MCLEPYAIPAPGETIFSCTACSAVLHGECYKRFKESDRKRAQQRYGAQIEAHHVARPDSLCSPQVFPCTRCPECRRPNAVFTRLPRKRAKPIRTQKQDLGAQLVMLRGRQDRILELRRLAQHGAMSKTRPIWPAGAAHVADWPRLERLAEENEGQRGADRSGAEIHALGAEPAGRGMVRATCLQLYTRRLGAAPANAVSSGQKGKLVDALVVRGRKSSLAHTSPTPRLPRCRRPDAPASRPPCGVAGVPVLHLDGRREPRAAPAGRGATVRVATRLSWLATHPHATRAR